MKFGALPPPEHEWQLGKTVATIRFVREAEAYLALDDDDIDYKFRSILNQQIKLAKEGKLTLLEGIKW